MSKKVKACSGGSTPKQAEQIEYQQAAGTPVNDSTTQGAEESSDGAEKVVNFPVRDVLPAGKKNAVKPEALCQMLGISSTRALRAEIKDERCKGALILSDVYAGGYYLPGTLDEVKEFKAMMEARGKSTFASIKAARKYIREAEDDVEGKP